MKAAVGELIKSAVIDYSSEDIDFSVDYTKQESHGDLATNVALKLAKSCGSNPRDIAISLKDKLEHHKIFKKIEIAGPGFINFYLADNYFHSVVREFICKEKVEFPQVGAGEKVLLEYVSANPTGPLHVGHGRGAAFGSTLANIFKALGYEVVSEYYLNDAGRQMDILALSTWLRYLELCNVAVDYPNKCYQGDYVKDIAKEFHVKFGDSIWQECSTMLSDGFSVASIEDEEQQLDLAVDNFKSFVSEKSYDEVHSFTMNYIKEGIRSDLLGFRVEFQSWFSEKSLYSNNLIDKVFDILKEKGHLYQENEAYWFAATNFGDDKDRVFRRSNGAYTYFAADLAYHWQKFQSDFTKIIDVFGADHHGYIPRLTAGLKALGLDEKIFSVLLVQFASLIKSGEKVSMSTRSGEFVTLVDLYKLVGVDAARFFYAMIKVQNHMDFDLDVATKKSMDNPVFYVQYAHARICSVIAKYNENYGDIDYIKASESLSLLSNQHERKIFLLLAKFTAVVEKSSVDYAPQQIVNYLQELASCFHSYYNAVTFIGSDAEIAGARIGLLHGVAKIIKTGMQLLGVTSPEQM
jgi:arginyl-tRNA synthetase